MNKLFIITLLIFSMSGMLKAQKSYLVKFNESDFEYITDNKGQCEIFCKKIGYVFSEDIELPALPYKMINILIPPNANISNFNIDINKELIKKEINIKNNPTRVRFSNRTNTSNQNSFINYRQNLYPSENATLVGINKMQGYYIASFKICPFIYSAKNKELFFITDLKLTLNVNQFKTTTLKKETDSCLIKSLIINKDELNYLYPQGSSSVQLKSGSTSSDIEYLIVTSSNLASHFEPLKAWKIQKGIRAEIISTTDIYSTYSGATDQLKIKNCLKDYYENKGLKWVLLGGDDTVVPVQGCYGEVATTPPTIDNTIPCDLFYSAFDYTFNWDQDGDGIVGEYNDGVDLYSEIYISRAPVRSSADVNAFVNKTLSYEKYPPTSGYANEMLLAGTELWDTWNGESDAHQRSEAVYSQHIAPLWLTGSRDRFYDTGTDFAGGAGYDLTNTHLETQLNSGYHFVHMATHGSQTAWSMETGAGFGTANASALTNGNSSIIITIACNTNMFDNASGTADPCLSEAFLRNPNGGCVLYWGSSRFGWGYDSQSTNLGDSFDYSSMFWQYLFDDNQIYRFAEVTTNTKLYYAPANPVKRWLQFTLNAIGDPELPIYTDNPQTFENVTITQSGTSITVNTGQIVDCTIAVTSIDFGKTYFQTATDIARKTFYNVNVPCYITITKKNYKPFIYPADLYIQNFTFTEDAYVKNNRIYAGRNVTSSLPEGDVVIKNGSNVKFIAEQGITLASGFKVEKGATFKAKIEPLTSSSTLKSARLNDRKENIFENQPIIETKDNIINNEFVVFPNPTTNYINIAYEVPDKTNIKIELFSLSGNKIKTMLDLKEQAKGNYEKTFSVSDIKSGTYLILFSTTQKRIAKTLIISN